MDWRDCYTAMIESRVLFDPEFNRFTWPPDGLAFFNCEEGLTVSDVIGAANWVVSYPGDLILQRTTLGAFFEYDTPVIGATPSIWIGWVAVLLVVAGLVDLFKVNKY